MKIEILRLSHRIQRDPRLSTHVALTARAFLASKLYYSGDKDSSLENSLNKVSKQFGGDFKIEHIKDPIKLIKEKRKEKYLIVHLTCYGERFDKKISEIRKNKNILVIVGGEKVPPKIYQLSNLNLSVTNQPHSEVGSLAIFLHGYFQGKEFDAEFKISQNFKNTNTK
jgi:tRNA (cytidine56-2'-O)-methyltransferase